MDDQTKTTNQDLAETANTQDPQINSYSSEDNSTQINQVVDTKSASSQFDYLQNLQSQINIYLSRIENLKQEIQPVKEMIDSYLSNDPLYAELSVKAKESTKEKSKRKKELMSSPNGKALNQKMEKIKEEQNEANEMLSQLLSEYQKATGATVFEGADGEIRQIVMIAKLIRKTNLNRD
ncbi:MAG: hypothetical protein NZM26_00050 [Patescibacteria group bacterium]|nr:hypothetical protein [Patescibacteria group bacterium]